MRVVPAVLVLAASLAGQAPRVDAMKPRGGQRGTEVEVTFRGRRLIGPQGLYLEREGLEVVAVEGSDDHRRAAVTLRLPGSCPLGLHPLRLRTATGIGPLMMFHVGPLPQVADQDGEDGAVQELPFGCTVDGELAADDEDRFAVEVPAGTWVTCEVQAVRLGGRPSDLMMEVRDPEGALVLEADDSMLGRKDPIARFRAGTAGRYEIALRGRVPAQRFTKPYRLHVGAFPRPTAVHPCGGRPGETLEVALLGDPGLADARAEVTLPDGGGSWAWFPETDAGTAPTPVYLAVNGLPTRTPREVEGEDGPPRIEVPGAVHGRLVEPGQVDRWYFEAEKGERLMIRAVARRLRSPLDAELIVRYASGRYIGYNDDRGGADAVLRFRAPADGVFRVDVRDLLGRGSADRVYRLEIQRQRRGFNTRLQVNRSDPEPTVAVPRGGRTAALLVASNVDGEGAEPLLEDLPEGVEVAHGGFTAATPYVPLVFTAAAEAPHGGSLARILRVDGEGGARRAGFRQQVPLVTVRNDRPYILHGSSRVPVAVVDEAPFAIEVEVPPVPLVQGAYLRLPVTVHRAGGFEGRVRLSLLYDPPGIGSGRATLNGDDGEARLYVGARGNARTGTWPIAVEGTTTIDGGRVEISSPLLSLEVVEPWVVANPAPVRTEQGRDAVLEVALEWRRPVEEPFTARLTGLPRGVTAGEVRVGPGDEKVGFDLAVAPDAAAGRHRNVRVELRVPHPGGTALHRFGGQIRIDRPLGRTTGGER